MDGERRRGERRSIDRLARWLVRRTGAEPGWDALVLEVLSVGRDVRAQVREVRGTGTCLHPVEPDRRLRRTVRRLQAAQADLVDGTWLSATLLVSVAGSRWERPVVELVLHHDDDPRPPAHAPHPVTAEDLRRHLAAHRRMGRKIPDWARERLAAAGLEVPER